MIIVWDPYETAEVLFEDYGDAVAYYEDWKDYGEACYLTSVLRETERA